jgi:DNA-binding CsgD family transcriptional regulator
MPRPILHGREPECALVERMIEAARAGRSDALVVRGEAGVGKTAVLDHAATAVDVTVLRAAGVEAESELSYAALHQLLLPVLGLVPRIPAPQSAALRGAFGLHDGRPERFRVSLAVLSLLAEAAEGRPLLCLVDDAQWLDRPSTDALLFCARRLDAEGVVLVFAARDGEPPGFDAPGLAELLLTGLPDDAATEFLAVHAPAELAPAVRDELVRLTRGNPLALAELPGALDPAQLIGRRPLPDPLPLTDAVKQVYLGRVRLLPPDTRDLLEVAAAEDAGDVATVLAAGAALGHPPEALDAAERAGLVVVTAGGLRFHHPLVRSAIYGAATYSRRRAVHGALADVLDTDEQHDRHAWHRAAAVLGTDERVAEELERAARRARNRGAPAAAGAALERAAELTRDAPTRVGRLLAAAVAFRDGGQLDRMGALLDAATPSADDPAHRADIAYQRAHLERIRGVLTHAYDVLMLAAGEVASVDPARAARMLAIAGLVAADAQDLPRLRAAAARAERLVSPGEAPFDAQWVRGVCAVMSGDAAGALPLITDTAERARRGDHPGDLLLAGTAAAFVGDDLLCAELLARGIQLARRLGTPAGLAVLLGPAAMVDMVSGRFASAAAAADEGIRFAELVGAPNLATLGQAVMAWVDIVQGRPEQGKAHAASALALALDHGYAPAASVATWALGLGELGAGRPEEALATLLPLATPGSGRHHVTVALCACGDLVEAAQRVGETAAVMPVLDALERLAAATGRRWAQAVAGRCRALSGDTDVDADFSAALDEHAGSTRPFEHARTALLYGEHLRRQRRRIDARPHLRTASEIFERLGAEPWAVRACGELRASGETARRRDPSTVTQLTPQELQIVRIVNAGATNREVAAQLFLSPRTVDYHLRKVFLKLGLTSRAELARLTLDGAGAPA